MSISEALSTAFLSVPMINAIGRSNVEAAHKNFPTCVKSKIFLDGGKSHCGRLVVGVILFSDTDEVRAYSSLWGSGQLAAVDTAHEGHRCFPANATTYYARQGKRAQALKSTISI